MHLDGIYGGIETIPPEQDPSHIGAQAVHIVFFRDGSILWALPPEGLGGSLPSRDVATWKDDWGRYVADNEEVRIDFSFGARVGTWKDGRLHFERDGYGRKVSFILWPRLSGPVLEGMYKFTPNSPGIRFVSDGRFVDEGFQADLGTFITATGELREPNTPRENQARRPGAGIFSLENYTLELRYEDGRIVRFPLLVAPSNAEQLPISSFAVFGSTLDRV